MGYPPGPRFSGGPPEGGGTPRSPATYVWPDPCKRQADISGELAPVGLSGDSLRVEDRTRVGGGASPEGAVFGAGGLLAGVGCVRSPTIVGGLGGFTPRCGVFSGDHVLGEENGDWTGTSDPRIALLHLGKEGEMGWCPPSHPMEPSFRVGCTWRVHPAESSSKGYAPQARTDVGWYR